MMGSELRGDHMDTPMWTTAHVVRHELKTDFLTVSDYVNRGFTQRVLVGDSTDIRPDRRGWAPEAIVGDANLLFPPERANRNRDLAAMNPGRTNR